MIPSSNARLSLAAMLPLHGLWVELGVAAGAFAEQVCGSRDDVRYLGIDRWTDHHDAAEMKQARARLRRFPNAVLCRNSFEEAARTMPEESCDAVYVDGYAHTGQECGRTLDQWWSKVRRGGLLCGHDYDAEKWPHTFKAVNYFAGHRGLTVCVIHEASGYASWYIRRPMVDASVLTGSCVLVGNGPSLRQQHLGSRIDAFDDVIRFNDYQLADYAGAVGLKTSLWSCYGANAQRQRPHPPHRVIYLHGTAVGPQWYQPEEIWRVPLALYNAVRDEVRSASKLDDGRIEKLLPSSGLVTLKWLLDCHRAPRIHLAGFDHFSRDGAGCSHHYWLTGSYSAPVEHDGTAEFCLFAEMENDGRAVRLTSDLSTL